MNKRTIILLGARRSGTTSIYDAFRKHTQVKIAHETQTLNNFEPNYWSRAYEAINGKRYRFFNDRFRGAYPFIEELKEENIELNNDVVFEIWDKILKHLGPIVFSKSPELLLEYCYSDVLSDYIKTGKDVRIISVIRDPRDCIISQYLKFNKGNGDIKPIEENWIQTYTNLEKIIENKKIGDVLFFRYEDMVKNISKTYKRIFDFCEIKDEKEAYDHVKSVHVCRYKETDNPVAKRWLKNLSDKTISFINKYYKENQWIVLTAYLTEVACLI